MGLTNWSRASKKKRKKKEKRRRYLPGKRSIRNACTPVTGGKKKKSLRPINTSKGEKGKGDAAKAKKTRLALPYRGEGEKKKAPSCLP